MLDRNVKGIVASGAPRELEQNGDPQVRQFFQRRAGAANSTVPNR
jgi:ABC-type transporter Mla maintaining outer membrane lipid asymmetry ATPase subunit MlaF